MVQTITRALNIVNIHVVTTKMKSPKRNDISSFLKEENDLEVERRAGGRLFHARGPATANARSPVDARRVGNINVREGNG